MSGLLAKVILCPVAVLVADFLLPNVNYANIYQPLIIGLLIALIGHLMEVLFLQRGTFWISNALDFAASFALIYGSQFVLRGVDISFIGALITSLILLATEYIQHLLLIRGHKTQKV